MIQLNNLANFFCTLLICTIFSFPLYSQWSNGQPAVSVIGQPDFVTKNSNIFGQLAGIAIDKTTKKVFIADLSNGRILRFSQSNALLNGASPEAQFNQINGQPIDGLTGLFVDSQGNLWVAEINKNRVLRIPNANSMTSITADLVLGQPNFTSTTEGTQLNQMHNPYSVFVKDNVLWVSLQSSHKILRFDNVSSLTNGATANAYLGSAPGTDHLGTTAAIFSGPSQIYVDQTNNLWIADALNNRVLKFNNAKTFTNGASASIVLGQTNFTTNTLSLTQNSLGTPRGVYGDALGNLYVSQWNDHRVFIFKKAANITNNNAPADGVLGQSDFTTGTSATSSTGFSLPDFLYVDEHLWVADAGNERVLRFEPSTPLPVTLTSYTATKNSNGQIKLNWQTASEANSSHFSVQTSTDGKDFKQIAVINSKAVNGNSSSTLDYTFLFNPNDMALAGFGLLGLLLIPAFRNRFMKVLFIAIAVFSIASCTKEELEEEKTVYVKLIQVDLDGLQTDIGIVAVKSGKQIQLP